MNFKKILEQFNFPAQAKKYGIPLWQYPQFLFLVMGVIIIGAMLFSYIIGNRYIEDPFLVAIGVIVITFILIIIAFIITQSFERLAEASRMKSEFIGIVSHQLKTPLSNLKWVVELLVSGRLDNIKGKQLEFFQILKENTGRMTQLITDLLTVYRIEEKFELKKEKIFVDNFLKEIINEFNLVAKTKNIKIIYEIGENTPEILTDPLQLKLAIENLLDNAIRYSKENGEIKIYLGRKNNNFYFEIKDNGIGIPKEDQKYIFQRFFRAINAKSLQPQGSGLGLYIIKLIINKLGGQIGFQSKENKGSTFWFTLPIK
jgi:signal transduction histidine kinase